MTQVFGDVLLEKTPMCLSSTVKSFVPTSSSLTVRGAFAVYVEDLGRVWGVSLVLVMKPTEEFSTGLGLEDCGEAFPTKVACFKVIDCAKETDNLAWDLGLYY